MSSPAVLGYRITQLGAPGCVVYAAARPGACGVVLVEAGCGRTTFSPPPYWRSGGSGRLLCRHRHSTSAEAVTCAKKRDEG